MEWRGVTLDSAFIGNFFFAAAVGLFITAQWEMAVGNGVFYTVFGAIGLFTRLRVEHRDRVTDLPRRSLLCQLRGNSDPSFRRNHGVQRQPDRTVQCTRIFLDK